MGTKTRQSASTANVLPIPRTTRRPRAKTRAGKDQERLLDMALNNMSQGLLIFDSATRLLFCNQRYIEMYGLSPEVVKPGCTLRDLLKHRMAAGTFSGNP